MNSKRTFKQLSSDVFSLILQNKALFILIIICSAIALKEPVFFSSRNLVNVIRQISMSAVLGIGFTVILTSGSMDLSVGTMLGLIGVVMAKLSLIDGMPFWLVMLAGIAMGAMCGALNGFVSTRFGLPPFIVTLATGQVFKGACYLISNTSPVTGIPDVFVQIGQGYWGPVPIPVYIMAAVGIVVAIILYSTRFGRHAVAIGGNAEAARVSGVNVGGVRIGVYVLMGICVAIAAAIMTGRAASAQPAAGQGMEMDAIAAVVMGGTPLYGGSGKVMGTVFGCLIVGVINNGLNLLGVDTNWQLVAKGLLILFAVLMDVQTEKFFKKRQNRV